MARFEPERTFTVFPKLPQEIRLMIWEFALPGPRVVNIRQRRIKKTIGEWESESGKQWPIPRGGSESEPDSPTDNEQEYQRKSYPNSSENARFRCDERDALASCLGAKIYKCNDKLYKQAHLTGVISEQPFPIPYVCRESYEVVSKSYARCFRCLGSVASTWFNFDNDTLYLRCDTFSSYRKYQSDMDTFTDDLGGGHRLMDTENLRKVKKLAILVEKRQLEEPELAAVLEAFGNVEELSLVVDHRQDVGDEDELLITEPIDYEKTQRAYQDFNPRPGDADIPVPIPFNLDTSRAEFDMTYLEGLRYEDINIFGTFPWKIPVIKPKVVLAKLFTEQLEVDKECRELMMEEIIEKWESMEKAEDKTLLREIRVDIENE